MKLKQKRGSYAIPFSRAKTTLALTLPPSAIDKRVKEDWLVLFNDRVFLEYTIAKLRKRK